MGRAADFFTPLLERQCRVVAVVTLSADRAGSDRFEASWTAKVRATAAVLGRCASLLSVRSPDAIYLPISQWGLPLARDVLVITLARVTGCTPVLHLHGAQLPARLAASGVLRTALAGAHWIVLSDTVATELRTSRCRARSVTVVRNPAPAAGTLGRGPARPRALRIGWLGTRCRAKGFDVLCRAVGRLKDRGVDVQFSAAGMRLDVPDAHMSSVDEDLGVLAPGRASSFWSRTDVFVLPSRWAEGLPFVIIEALQAGCAVAATPSPGSAELFGRGCVERIESTTDSVTAFLENCVADLQSIRRRQQRAWEELRPIYAPQRVEESFVGFWRDTSF
ncbi:MULTISPECIES: glycosyltransferase family 4 protein [unclassified Streptomyces]|nr:MULTISPECIES: glycosyltransferase family 4 protein [unclassified Streptomyces]